MREGYRFPERKQKNVCTICGEAFIWCDESVSIAHGDDVLLKTCSQHCLDVYYKNKDMVTEIND